ncbi:DUF2235 domain-containing protein [Mycena kentingensis (nom. inval.)]|nr:DUF2235 domain-containing protein [Mycena kentingensis (nom. inval.)]
MADPRTHVRSFTESTVVDVAAAEATPSTLSPSLLSPQNSTNGNIIPPEHPFRTLVLCFDGTGDQFDSDNSNIVQFFSMLPKSDRSRQMVYYQAGIGTYTSPQIADPLWARISKFIDEAIAWDLDAHVMGGYEFLMQNYTANDRICIFGFSRGAYIARSLAGMIHKARLCSRSDLLLQLPFAYKMYTRTDEVGWQQSNAFKKAFSNDVDIEFVGVWDTVDSVGLIPRRLPFTTSNTIVRTFRHAIALDEHRAKFKVNLWNRQQKHEECLGLNESKHAHKAHTGTNHKHALHGLEKRYARDPTKPTDVEEVWFAGCHCDVGGGSVSNETTHNLARIPLRWMIRECFRTNSGIMFDCDGLRSIGMDPDALYPFVKPRPSPLAVPQGMRVLRIGEDAPKPSPVTTSIPKSEEEHDLSDALTPIYDQLSLKWFWWILELLPLRQRHQRDGDNAWVKYFTSNLGRARVIPHAKHDDEPGVVKVHRSVRTRMEAEAAVPGGAKYTARAVFKLGNASWVD